MEERVKKEKHDITKTNLWMIFYYFGVDSNIFGFLLIAFYGLVNTENHTGNNQNIRSYITQ